MLRVMIADDDPMVRLWLRGYIEAEGDMQIVAEASSGHQAIELAGAHQPAVVILDVGMPDGSGVVACREIRDRHPEIKVIMLTSHSEDEALFDSIVAGAAGYLIKGVSQEEVIRSIRTVGKGRALLDPVVTQRVLDRVRNIGRREKDPKLATLSPMEERILDLVAMGLTNRQIAERIHLSDKIIKNNVSSMMQKLQVARRSGAAAYIARLRSGDDVSSAPADEKQAAPVSSFDQSTMEKLESLGVPGSEDSFGELIEMFLADFGPGIREVRSAVAEQDATRASKRAHFLKGSCLYLGAVRLSGLLGRLEDGALSGDLSKAPKILDAVDEEFAVVKEVLEKSLNKRPDQPLE